MMMREILFRGKGPSGWVFGDFQKSPEGLALIVEHNFPWSVMAETVGQYTGVTDCKGTKIFEGDLVRVTNGEYGIVYFKYGMFIIVADDGSWIEVDDCGGTRTREIIGNIHDNPELVTWCKLQA